MDIHKKEREFYHELLKVYSSLKLEAILDFCSRKRENFNFNGIVIDRHFISKVYFYALTYEGLMEQHRINNRKRNRKSRLRKRISNMINCPFECYFLTLTFEDLPLNVLTIDERKNLIRKFLKSNFIEYVANIDYGGNDREHYHAIVVSFDNILDLDYKFGFYNFQKIFKEEDKFALSEYINKLTNHSIKFNSTLIYSRQKK